MMMCLVQEAEEEETAVEGEQEEEETRAEGEEELRVQAVGDLQSVEEEEPEEEQEEGLHLLIVVEEIKSRMLCLWILSGSCSDLDPYSADWAPEFNRPSGVLVDTSDFEPVDYYNLQGLLPR
mgnify:CR=1 FL=1